MAKTKKPRRRSFKKRKVIQCNLCNLSSYRRDIHKKKEAKKKKEKLLQRL